MGPLPLEEIEKAAERFLLYAFNNPELDFLVTRVGCVLAGYSDAQIAPMFANAPVNCSLPDTWAPILSGPSKTAGALLAH